MDAVLVKAMMRRGLVKKESGRLQEALKDFEKVRQWWWDA